MKRISDLPIRYVFYPAALLFLVSAFFLESCSSPEDRYEYDSIWSLPSFKKIEGTSISLTDTNRFYCPLQQKRIKWNERLSVSCTVVRGKLVYLFYTAQDSNDVSRIGVAISGDGIHFSNINQPILFPAEDFMKQYELLGISNPHIVENENGTYLLNYTAYDGKTSRLCFATSTDLLNWVKQGPAFSDKYFDMDSASGAILSRQDGNRIVAEKINNKYWMYFGNKTLFADTSDDLTHWVPVESNDEGEEKIILPIAEISNLNSWPFALKTEQGIVIPFNREGMASQVLFDIEDPTKVIDRLQTPFTIAGEPAAKELAGLVTFNNSWLLYYPGADSKICIATSQP